MAERYVGAYNGRDSEAKLAVQDENIVSHPTRLVEVKTHKGHDGVRAWWAEMAASGRWYHVVIREVRQPDHHRIVILGDICYEGERVSPWCVVVRASAAA